jgi:predicted  nucleic acid-binding Zn-ribbon protein
MSSGLESGPFVSNVGREKDQISMRMDYLDDEMTIVGDSLQITPSTLEVDYDKNLTELYQAITDQDWKRASFVCQTDPIQAATWVVRHYNDDNDENFSASMKSPEQEPEIMWRFLPLHSACARQPPRETVVALLNAYPDAAKCVDDQGMYALHYACGNQADESVIKLLLLAFSKAAAIPDPRGMLPLHYMACWGPSSSSYSHGVLNELIQAHPPALTMCDFDGNTPLDLSMDGDYPEKKAVAEVFRQWTSRWSSEKTMLSQGSNIVAGDHSQKKTMKLKLLSIRQTNSHGSGYNDAIFVDQSVKIPLEPPASHSEDSTSIENNPVANLATATTANSSLTPTPRLSNGLSLQSESRESAAQVMSEVPLLATRIVTVNKGNVSGTASAVDTVLSFSSTRQNESSNVEQHVFGTEKTLSANEGDVAHSALLASFNDMKSDLKEKTNHITSLEEELKSVRMVLEECKLECSGLRQSLGDLMDEHEGIKQKSANTHDRLSSLSVSLNSMKEQQSILSKIVTERNEICKSTAEKRQQIFDELLKMDFDVAEAEGHIDASLRKQTREMDAISAVINAALD